MKKILIVDDVETHLLALAEVLESLDVKILKASSGSEAIAISKEHVPDLIFMDIVMEEMSGFEACRSIKNEEITSEIPIVFVSSKNSGADKIWAQKQGGVGLISKPYKNEEIIQCAERLIKVI